MKKIAKGLGLAILVVATMAFNIHVTIAGQETVKQSIKFHFASEIQSGASIGADKIGLSRIKSDAALVYYSKEDKELAEQVAKLLGNMHRLAQGIAGIPLQVHGVILVSKKEELPAEIRNAFWANVGGVSCLVQLATAHSLAGESDFFHHQVFFLLVHESVDMGIKAELFGGRLTPESASSRWWVEGIADYAAYQAARRYDKRALVMTKKGYLSGLNKIKEPYLDISGAVWWPKGSRGPNDIQYAYAAANYVIATLSAKRGPKWILKTLAQLKRENKGNQTRSADFCRVASGLLGIDVQKMIRHVSVSDVRKFASSL